MSAPAAVLYILIVWRIPDPTFTDARTFTLTACITAGQAQLRRNSTWAAVCVPLIDTLPVVNVPGPRETGERRS